MKLYEMIRPLTVLILWVSANGAVVTAGENRPEVATTTQRVHGLLDDLQQADGDEWQQGSRRLEIARELALLSEPRERIVHALTKVLVDQRYWGPRRCSTVATAMTRSLAQIGDRAPLAVPALEAAVADQSKVDSRYDRTQGYLEVLGQLVPNRYPFYATGSEAIRPLLKVVTSGMPAEQRRAANHLAAMGKLAKSTLPKLRPHLASDDAHLRVAAANALWTIAGEKQAVPVIVEMSAHEDDAVRKDAVAALRTIESTADGQPEIWSVAVTALLKSSHDADDDIRQLGTDGLMSATQRVENDRKLGRLPMGQALEMRLESLLATHDHRVRLRAAAALYRFGSDKLAVTELRAGLFHEDRQVQLRAMREIRNVRLKKLARDVAKLLRDDDALVRRRARVELPRLAPQIKAVMPEIQLALNDSDPAIRDNAEQALARLTAP